MILHGNRVRAFMYDSKPVHDVVAVFCWWLGILGTQACLAAPAIKLSFLFPPVLLVLRREYRNIKPDRMHGTHISLFPTRP